MNFQLGGEFDKKRLDKLRRTTEHPRIKVEYGDFFLLKLIPSKVDKGRFSRTPRTKDADYNSLLGIKSEYMLSKILSGRNSTDSIIFGIFYRVVANDHHVSPIQIGTLWNESVSLFRVTFKKISSLVEYAWLLTEKTDARVFSTPSVRIDAVQA